MFRVALGQSKMSRRPVAGVLHIIVYLGFLIINIEVIEIVIDGIFDTHRFLASVLPSSLYNFLIGSFEVLAILVLVSCIIFLIRRNLLRINRFWNKEMTKWPRTDANLILIFEILLMTAFLVMNSADSILFSRGDTHYAVAFTNPVSHFFIPYFEVFSSETLHFIERFTWWFHIIGILGFMNYVLISKHLHIFFAFPSTYYANLNPLGQFSNLQSVTNEVKLMMDPSADPFAAPPEGAPEPQRFGAKDVQDLTWKNLLDSYTCIGGQQFMSAYAGPLQMMFGKSLGAVDKRAALKITKAIDTLLRAFPRAVPQMLAESATFKDRVLHLAAAASACAFSLARRAADATDLGRRRRSASAGMVGFVQVRSPVLVFT